MTFNNGRYKLFGFCIFAALCVMLVATSPAQAQNSGNNNNCLPGVPCIVNKTVNDPFVTGDGPATGPNNAKSADSKACDADFMNQIYARAYMQAEQDVLDSEVVIRKPDSVLEYTCFDQIVGIMATQAGSIASDVELGSGHLGGVLSGLVLNSLRGYRDQNFYHNFLGGYLTGQNSSFNYSASNSAYNCGVMNGVYYAAKCNDFATDDQFLSFSTLAQLDPRALPQQCPAKNTAITSQLIDLAANQDFDHVNFDETQTYMDRMIGGKDACKFDPIPTGVVVERAKFSFKFLNGILADKTQYDEGICPPGCSLSKNGKKCEPK